MDNLIIQIFISVLNKQPKNQPKTGKAKFPGRSACADLSWTLSRDE